MEYHVIVTPGVSRVIGSFGLSRSVLVRLLVTIHELASASDLEHRERDPEDDRLFFHSLRVAEGPSWHEFVLSVDDTSASGYLFVRGITYESRPN